MAGQTYLGGYKIYIWLLLDLYGKKGQGFWFAAHHEKSVLIAHDTADFHEPLGESFIKNNRSDF